MSAQQRRTSSNLGIGHSKSKCVAFLLFVLSPNKAGLNLKNQATS